jgi:hypothetical protein
MAEGMCGCCKCTVRVLYHKTALTYHITFIGNHGTAVLLLFLICLTSFCRTDPFLLLLKVLVGKGTAISEELGNHN